MHRTSEQRNRSSEAVSGVRRREGKCPFEVVRGIFKTGRSRGR